MGPPTIPVRFTVTIVLEVLNGNDVAQSGVIGPFKVEDDGESNSYGEATLVIPNDSLKTDPMTKMRLTMTTKDI
jgi:hypothetical protein